MKVPHFEKLYPRRKADRHTAAFFSLLTTVLLGMVLHLDDERKQLKREVKLAQQVAADRCAPPLNERDRVVTWRENGKTRCQEVIATETVVSR